MASHCWPSMVNGFACVLWERDEVRIYHCRPLLTYIGSNSSLESFLLLQLVRALQQTLSLSSVTCQMELASVDQAPQEACVKNAYRTTSRQMMAVALVRMLQSQNVG